MLCLAVGATALAATAAGEGLPLSLTDPATGSQVQVERGARALHLVFLAAWCSRCIDELDSLIEISAGDFGKHSLADTEPTLNVSSVHGSPS